jgi:hypothetical protein
LLFVLRWTGRFKERFQQRHESRDHEAGAEGSLRPLLSRIGFGDDDADGVLVESFEAAFALQILQMTHDRPSPTKCFCRMAFGRKNGELTDRN